MSYARAKRQAEVERKAWASYFSMRDRSLVMTERAAVLTGCADLLARAADLGIRAAVLRGRAWRISRAMDRWGEGVADLPGGSR